VITDKIKFYTGLAMLIAFVIVLVIIFSPVFGGKNGLDYMDELYNSISKGSAYYIPDVMEESTDYIGMPITTTIKMESAEQAENTALLYQQVGAEVNTTEASIEVNGDLGEIIGACLSDADAVYNNNGEIVREKYGYDEKSVLYNWWTSFMSIKKSLENKGEMTEANIVSKANERALEPAYNYYGIEPEDIKNEAGIVIFTLVFYIAYTVWYGFSLMYLLEGLGLKIRQMYRFSFTARVKQT
jgi:hypothetical protein